MGYDIPHVPPTRPRPAAPVRQSTRTETAMSRPELEDTALALAQALQRLVKSLEDRGVHDLNVKRISLDDYGDLLGTGGLVSIHAVVNAIPATDLALAESVVRRLGPSR